MAEVREVRRCQQCGTTRTGKFYGMRTGKIRCTECYNRERKIERKGQDNTRYYNMWER